jgi:hypothetical protein
MDKTVRIEGYEGFEMPEMYDDTPPDSVQVRFSVKAVEQPYLSEQANTMIYKNVVHISKAWELGRSSFQRPIRDKVEFHEASKKWKVLKLAANSDIAKYPNEWNAFQLGQSDNEIGTPLMFLFKTDPSRTEFYKANHITTIERLAALNFSNAQQLGLGVAEDINKAQRYLAETKESGAATALKARLEERDQQINSLQEQLVELQSRLSEVLTDKLEQARPVQFSAPSENIEPKRGRGRPRKTEQPETSETDFINKLNNDLGV